MFINLLLVLCFWGEDKPSFLVGSFWHMTRILFAHQAEEGGELNDVKKSWELVHIEYKLMNIWWFSLTAIFIDSIAAVAPPNIAQCWHLKERCPNFVADTRIIRGAPNARFFMKQNAQSYHHIILHGCTCIENQTGDKLQVFSDSRVRTS